MKENYQTELEQITTAFDLSNVEYTIRKEPTTTIVAVPMITGGEKTINIAHVFNEYGTLMRSWIEEEQNWEN